MAKKKPIVSPLGQWAYPGEVTIIPSSNITMKGVNYPVLGVDDLGNSHMMMPGQDYNFPGDYVTEIPQMGKGGLRQWFAEEWTDVKTGKPCGRSGDEKGSRPYPACRPKKRVNETTPKTTSEMSSAEKAKFKREKTSGKRIDYNHKRRQDGGETWLDQYQDAGEVPSNIERMQGVDIKRKKKNVSDSPRYQYDDKGNLLYTPELNIWPYASDGSSRDEFLVNPKLSVQNLNPTLEEFINVASPYYPIDNKLVTDPKINLQSSNYQRSLEQEYVLPQMIGKSFGNLPIIKNDGYSPNRRWVSNLRAKDTAAKFGKDSYAYVLKTNPNNLVDYSTKHAIEAAVSSNDKNFYDYLEKNNYSLNTVQELEKNRPDQIWNRAEQMRVEMRNNPEIMSWANLHNVDLGYKEKGKGDDKFAPKIPESIYANRLVKAGLPTNRPDYEYKPMETYIVQDPSKFDLAGYFPMGSIAKDAEQKVLNKKIPGKLKREYIYSNSPEYFEKEAYIKDEMARRMGINPSAFDSGEYLIHYNQSPITEYTPGKKYGGWLEQYQNAGEVLPKSIGAYTNQFNEEISGLKDWYEANRKRIGEIVPEAYLTYDQKSYPKPYGPEYDPMEYNFSAVKDYYNNKLIPGVKTLYDPITDTLSEQYVPPVFPFNFPKLDFTFNDNESPSTLEQGIANRFVYNLPPDYDRFATVKNYDANPPFVADWKGKQNINISNEPIDVDRFTAKNDPSTILSHETSHYLNKNNPEVFLFNRTKLAEMGITDTEGFKNYYGAGVVAKPSNTIDGAAKIYSGYDNDRKEDELLSDAYALKQDMRKKGFYDYTKGEKLTPEIWNKYKKEYGDSFIINRFTPVFEDQGQNNIEKLYNTDFPPLILNNNYNITDPFSPHLKNTKETPTFKTSDERIIHLLNQIVKNKDQDLNVAKYGGWLNKYQTGGSFTNLLKLALTPEVRGIVANQLVDKGVTKVAQKVGDASKQQIFDRYRPIDYPDVIGAIVNSGKDVPLRDWQGDYHVSEEAWRLALGLPTKSKYISPSKYKPSKASDPNAQYYSLNNVYDPQKLIDAYIQKAQGKPGQTVQMDALSPYIINQDMMTTDNEIPFTQTDPLQKFILSQGEDERGRYVSIYDKYDFNLPYMDAVVYGSNRKPYEFYDRFYYKKDAAGKPVYVKQKKQGGQTDWLNKYK